MQKVDYFVRVLKPSTLSMILKEVHRNSPHKRSSSFDLKRVAATKNGCQKAMMEHTKPLKLLNNMTMKKNWLHLCLATLWVHYLLNLFYPLNKVLMVTCVPWTPCGLFSNCKK